MGFTGLGLGLGLEMLDLDPGGGGGYFWNSLCGLGKWDLQHWDWDWG